MEQGRNRRRTGARARRRLRVTLPHCRSFTADVGLGGFGAELLRVLPPGTRVDGSFEIGGRSVPFAGKVAWAKAGDPYMGIRGRIGVVFTDAAAELVELLRLAVARPSGA